MQMDTYMRVSSEYRVRQRWFSNRFDAKPRPGQSKQLFLLSRGGGRRCSALVSQEPCRLCGAGRQNERAYVAASNYAECLAFVQLTLHLDCKFSRLS